MKVPPINFAKVRAPLEVTHDVQGYPTSTFNDAGIASVRVNGRTVSIHKEPTGYGALFRVNGEIPKVTQVRLDTEGRLLSVTLRLLNGTTLIADAPMSDEDLSIPAEERPQNRTLEDLLNCRKYLDRV